MRIESADAGEEHLPLRTERIARGDEPHDHAHRLTESAIGKDGVEWRNRVQCGRNLFLVGDGARENIQPHTVHHTGTHGRLREQFLDAVREWFGLRAGIVKVQAKLA